MKATAGRPQSVGRVATAGRTQPVEHGRVSLTSSLVWSLVLHGALVLWLLGSAWLLGRAQPYRLAPQTVFLVGDSPVAIDQVLGEGGGVPAAKPDSKEPGGEKSAQVETGAAPVVEKFAPPVEKPVPPPPQPVVEKAVTAPPPKPVVEKAAPPPPKPVVEKVAPPAPIPKPVVEKAVPAPLKPPPEAMPLAQKETKPTPPPAPPTSTSSEAQQKLAKLRERQIEQEMAETKTATAVQQKMAQLREQQAQQEAAEQRVASLRAEQAEKQAAQQRIAALRARVGSGGSGEGSGLLAAVPRVLEAGVVLLEAAEARALRVLGAQGPEACRAFVCVPIEGNCSAKIENAWNIPPQSKGLTGSFFPHH